MDLVGSLLAEAIQYKSSHNEKRHNMKKTSISSLFTLMAAVIVLTLVATGCTKETVTLRAQFEKFHAPNGQKLYIQEGTDGDNHSTFTPTWENDDPVYVNGSYTSIQVPASGDPTIQVVESSNGYTAIFTGGNASNNPVTNNGEAYTFTVPKTQYYNEVNGHQQINAPMYAHTSTGSTLLFKNMGALMLITLTNNTANETTPRDLIIDSVTVTASHVPLCGTATITITASDPDHPTYACTQSADEYKTIYLDFTNLQDPIVLGATSNTTKSVYISVPPVANGQENHYTIRVCAHQSDRTIIKYTHQQSSQQTNNGSIGRSQIAQIPFVIDADCPFEIIEPLPEGIVENALFTVGTNKQVYFSKGNLQWRYCDDNGALTTHTVVDNQGTRGGWRFADHQYDIIGSGNTNIASNYNGWIDLFGWATSGYDYKYPYSSYTTTSSYYSYNGNLSTETNKNYDWGVYNAISNGGNMPEKWRTLTRTEWSHLLSDRNVNGGTGNGHSYKFVTVNGVQGLLLFKDNYGTADDVAAVASTLDNVPDGCVFLPFAGYRSGTTVTNAGGYYWSARGASNNQAYAVSLSNESYQVSSVSIVSGHSVRLVMDVNNH